MKKFLLLGILLLSGCGNNILVKYETEILNNQVYAVNLSTGEVLCISIDYDIQEEKDIFLLYTNYQNNLPLDYYSPAHANIGLIDCYTKGEYTYYEVDMFINLVDDLKLFKECLSKTNHIYGYGDAVFLKNGKEVS